jgi:hypothetical protein
VNIFDNPPSVANLTSNFPRLYRNLNVSPRSPATEVRISMQYFWSLFAIPEKLKPRIISNLEISMQYFWTPSARKRLAANDHPKSPNSTISGNVAPAARQFSIFSFPFSSSDNMAP